MDLKVGDLVRRKRDNQLLIVLNIYYRSTIINRRNVDILTFVEVDSTTLKRLTNYIPCDESTDSDYLDKLYKPLTKRKDNPVVRKICKIYKEEDGYVYI